MSDQDINFEYISDVQFVGIGLVLFGQILLIIFYVILIYNCLFFLVQVLLVIVNEEFWVEIFELVVKIDYYLLVLFFMDNFLEDLCYFDVNSLFEYGMLVWVYYVLCEGGKLQFVVQGLLWVCIWGWIKCYCLLFMVEVDYLKILIDFSDEVKVYGMVLINVIKELLLFNLLYSEELKNYLNCFSFNDLLLFIDFVVVLIIVFGGELQEVLDIVLIFKWMEKVLLLLCKEVEVVCLQKELFVEVNCKIGEYQCEFFFKEQLKIIQQELGIIKDDKSVDVDEFCVCLEGKVLFEQVCKCIDEELNKLLIFESGLFEYVVICNYLDWVIVLFWGVYGKDKFDFKYVCKVFDKYYVGFDDIKDCIFEFFVVGSFKGEIVGFIVFLVGLLGVGKISIGKFIVESFGWLFYCFSVGGMCDEVEIKGYCCIYIGVLFGKLVQVLKEVEVMNLVIMFDEIDKFGVSYQGDLVLVLLEIFDLEQNVEFFDYYLDLCLDLFKVLFVCIVNIFDLIFGLFFDWMEVICLFGYIFEEKLVIVKCYLWFKQLEKVGVFKGCLSISDVVLCVVIEGYVWEVGVCQLEKQFGKLVCKLVVKLLEDFELKVKIGFRDFEDYFGMLVFCSEQVFFGIGVIIGLVWISMGGVILLIEVICIYMLNCGFKFIGQFGDVMKEFVEIVYSYIGLYLKKYGGDLIFFDQVFVYLYVLEGVMFKDGFSVGVIMVSVLFFLVCNQVLKKGVVMIGELILIGQVLFIGGVCEKVIVVCWQKIFELILLEVNCGYFEELFDYFREGLIVYFVKCYGDVVKVLFLV